MTIFRTSVAALAFLAAASTASGQSDGGKANAPPRQLGVPSAEQPPAVSTDGLKDDDANTDSKPVARSSDNQPPDVSTDGLLDDNEDVPAKAPPPSRAKSPEPVIVEQAASIIPKAEKVETSTLGAVDGSAAGVLDQSNGGFEANMWTGSSRDDVELLLSKAPLASPDSAVRSLARHVILSRADAPPGSFKRSLIAIRIEKLLNAGLIDDAGALAAAADSKDDIDLARVQANALLLAGRTNDICGEKTSARLSEGDLFWLQLRAYCAAASGDTATADLTRSVIDAQGLTDPAYNALVQDALTGGKASQGKIAKPTAIHLFLLRKAGLPIPPDVIARTGPAGDIIAMRDAHNLPETRLVAADRLLKIGAASTVDLKAVVDAQIIPPDQVANAAVAAQKLPFLKAQALLRRAAQLESRPPAKAALIHQALMQGDKAGFFEVAANLQADVAATIKGNGLAQSEGPLIGWALLIAGKPAAAGPWLGDNNVATAVLGLVAGKDDTAQAALSSIATSFATERDKTQNASRPMEALLLGLYDALGRTLPADAKAEASSIQAQHMPGRRPDETVMQKMLAASAIPNRKGEAILRILDIVGAKGPGDLAPDVTIEIVRTLEAMGIKDAARVFSIHALLLYRPGTA
jgi:hypothetical protein